MAQARLDAPRKILTSHPVTNPEDRRIVKEVAEQLVSSFDAKPRSGYWPHVPVAILCSKDGCDGPAITPRDSKGRRYCGRHQDLMDT